MQKKSLLRLFLNKGKWYLLSSIFTKGIAFLTLPVYTNNLSPSDFGKLDSFNSITQIFVILVSLYIDSALARFYHYKKENFEKLQELFSTTVLFVLAYGTIALVGTLLSTGLWFENFFDVSVWPFSFLIFSTALLQQIYQLGIVFYSQELEASKVASLQIVFSLGSAILGIFCLLALDLGILSKLYGVFVVSFVLSLYVLFTFYKRGLFSLKFKKAVLKELLLYSIPLLPNVMSGWIMGLSDRLILAKYLNFTTVGVYAVGAQLSKLLYITHDVYTKVQGPVSLSLLAEDEDDAKAKIAQMSFSLLCIMLFAHIFLIVFVNEILLIFNKPEYTQAGTIIGILGATHIFTSQYRVYTINLMHKEKTFVIAVASIISAIINLVLNILFIPKYGFLAAAWSTFFSVVIYFLWIFSWSQAFIKIKLPWKSIFLCILAHLLIIGFYLYFCPTLKKSSIVELIGFKSFCVMLSIFFYIHMLKNVSRRVIW